MEPSPRTSDLSLSSGTVTADTPTTRSPTLIAEASTKPRLQVSENCLSTNHDSRTEQNTVDYSPLAINANEAPDTSSNISSIASSIFRIRPSFPSNHSSFETVRNVAQIPTLTPHQPRVSQTDSMHVLSDETVDLSRRRSLQNIVDDSQDQNSDINLETCDTDNPYWGCSVTFGLSEDRRVPPKDTTGLLPPEYHREAEEDLHEKQAWLQQDVEALRDLLLREPLLRPRTDDPFLLSFLRARKYDYDRALAMVLGYYRARQENAPFYVGLTASSLQDVWQQQLQAVLPRPDRLGRTVLVFRAGAWDPSVVPLDSVFKAQVLLLEHSVRLPITQLKGVAAVVDCAGLGRVHASNLTAGHLRRMVAVVQEVFPLRFKALHFIHEPVLFEWMFGLVKPLLSETIKSRLHFHGSNHASLHEHISPECLPKELGGHQPALDNTHLVELLNKEEQYFQDHFSYGYVTGSNPPSPTHHSASCSTDEDPAMTSSASTGSLMGSVADVGSFLGSYYRKMCID